jgi:membrane-associated protease RseP (regulator of RpoE activity)
MGKQIKNSPKVLGLDISTKTIGWALFEVQSQELLELTHISPRPKMVKGDDDKLKELILKSEIFAEKLKQYVNLGIVKVIIEEPLLNSNNIYTIQTLLRFNSFVFKEIYNILGIIPEFVSTYNSRKYAWPELVQENDKGKFVLFGGLPKDIDKKMLIWEKVAKREPQITWGYTKNNTLKKENFDQTDAYTCVLGYMRLKEIWK